MWNILEQTLSARLGRQVRNPVQDRIMQKLDQARETRRLRSVRRQYNAGKITRREAKKLGLKA